MECYLFLDSGCLTTRFHCIRLLPSVLERGGVCLAPNRYIFLSGLTTAIRNSDSVRGKIKLEEGGRDGRVEFKEEKEEYC